MAEGDFGSRGRTAEDDYFYKKDRELIESEMAAQIRINDPGLIDDLKELGFTPETVKVLPLMPIVQLAWAEGGVSAAERTLLVSLARNRGIAEGRRRDHRGRHHALLRAHRRGIGRHLRHRPCVVRRTGDAGPDRRRAEKALVDVLAHQPRRTPSPRPIACPFASLVGARKAVLLEPVLLLRPSRGTLRRLVP